MFSTDYPKATWHPSGNYWKGNDPQHGRLPARCIVLHGTGGFVPGCLEWLCTPDSNVSAHYVVARDGTVYQLVRESDVSWANGEVSAGGLYPALPNPNRFTAASIETENDSNNSLAFTDAQYAAVVGLIRDIRTRHGNLPLIPHKLIDPVNRPFCPGPQIPLAQIDKESCVATDEPEVELGPWPYTWSQYNDFTGDGQPDENASMNCGFEVDSQAMMYFAGINLGADIYKDLAMGQGYTGYSDYPDHEKLLNTYLSVPTGRLRSTNADTVRQHIIAWLTKGHPALVLFWWDRQKHTGGHFVAAVGAYADGRLVIANPAGGKREILTPDAFRQAHKADALALNRKRSIVW